MVGYLVVALAVFPVPGGILPHVHEGVAIWESSERGEVFGGFSVNLLHDGNQQVDHHHGNQQLVPEKTMNEEHVDKLTGKYSHGMNIR